MTTRPVPAGLSDLADFRATPETATPEETRDVRAAAAAHGFIERSRLTPRKRRRPADEPMYSFTARVTVRSADRFIEWCEEERISYREGFERLVGLIPKDKAR
ncbi:hypothetical protein MBUL_04500 (plasmid) [Methylobacterium bullatum]|uniref:Uncharacterized protein n=1 Tax=Methylobacterium bullatum TaxID=570505 RepID=A0A679JNU4_9HYPH|nr:hypothetical protein MBUL_04500 [Methylobacterium bullatum]